MGTVGMSIGWRRQVAAVTLVVSIGAVVAADGRADERDREPPPRAARHHCQTCGQAVALPLPPQRVELVGTLTCRVCYLRADHRWQSIDHSRYATFADGTLVDLKHFRASMLTSQLTGPGVRTAFRGVVAANLAGWGVEWLQVAQGHVGGQPFGGNEDLRSNLAGSLFGQLARFTRHTTDWAEQAVAALERFHGPLHSVSDTK